MARNQSVSGLTPEEIDRISELATNIEHENPALSISNKEAVMWAVNNELEKYD